MGRAPGCVHNFRLYKGTEDFAKRTQLLLRSEEAGRPFVRVRARRQVSCGEDLWGHCRKRRLLAAEAARPHDRSPSSGAPGNLGHLQPG